MGLGWSLIIGFVLVFIGGCIAGVARHRRWVRERERERQEQDRRVFLRRRRDEHMRFVSQVQCSRPFPNSHVLGSGYRQPAQRGGAGEQQQMIVSQQQVAAKRLIGAPDSGPDAGAFIEAAASVACTLASSSSDSGSSSCGGSE